MPKRKHSKKTSKAISRKIAIVKNEHPEMESDQAAAVAMSILRKRGFKIPRADKD
jgi:hypothetical protein